MDVYDRFVAMTLTNEHSGGYRSNLQPVKRFHPQHVKESYKLNSTHYKGAAGASIAVNALSYIHCYICSGTHIYDQSLVLQS